jgi:hypothetical protein
MSEVEIWEYRVATFEVATDAEIEERLNVLGLETWELVSFQYASTCTAILKRPKIWEPQA